LHAGTRTTEPSRERVVLWDFVNGLDAESDKLCDRAGMNSGKTQNVVVRNRGIAMIEKLASEWIATVPSSRNVGSLRHCENSKFWAQLKRKLGLQSLNLPGQVPNPEEAACVDRAALIHVISTHVRQARCREIDSRTGHHAMLDRNVADMVVSNIRGRFDLNEPPSTVPASMQNIDAHEHAAVLECAFEDCGTSRFAVSSRVARISWSNPSLRTSTPPGNIWRASSPTSPPCSMSASLAVCRSAASSGSCTCQ
jgi:hypothetical protein